MSKGDDFLCASEGKNPPVNHVRRFKSRVLGKQRSAGFTSERLGTDIATYAPDKTSMAATVSKRHQQLYVTAVINLAAGAQ